MYSDPDGNFAISALIIGLIFGFAGTLLTDLIDDGFIFNGSQDWRDYLGNTLAGGIGGLASAFGLNMLGSILFSTVGDVVGGLISRDINSWQSLVKTIAISVSITIFSSGISSQVSDLYGAYQYKKIRNVSVDNTKVNKYIKNLGKSYKKANVTSLKIGRNSMDEFINLLRDTTPNIIVTEITNNVITQSLGIWF